MKPVWVLMCAIAVVGANSLVLSPIAADVALDFVEKSAPDVMLASAVYGGSTAVSALFLAPRADQMGLKRALIVALVILVIALFISALAPSLDVLTFAQGLAGIGAGLALPATYGLAADVSPKGQESATLGKVLTGWTLSLVAGVSFAAVLADLLHWRAVFGLMAALSAGLSVLIWKMQVPQRAAVQAVSPFKAFRVPGLLPILLAVVCFMSAFYGLYAYLGAHLTTILGFSTGMAGLGALTYGVGFGMVAPLDRLIDRFGATRAAPVVFGALLLVYLLMAVCAGQGLAIFGVCLFWGAVNHMGLNILVGQMSALSPSQRGAILGLYSATTYVAMFVGTAAFRPVFETQGFAVASVLSAACVAPALISALWTLRRSGHAVVSAAE
ncbi:MFS transporter [Shimia sagamensis]|uniref:Predicted arabinose efflux permease, MFS family n=1 Tax=Shimia sagamensis TaxID=1566352 RepID=A0ABY1P1F7_9RHOB|nr:MFS transporter [Shimia sagamensis]SMP24039.1 Predicted arabinose efflux permease, MFS family [Shimia sagamensis]